MYNMLDAPMFHNTSHVTHHTSHVTRHTSHITHHTSHITRHTSHVTPYSPHSTRKPNRICSIPAAAVLQVRAHPCVWGFCNFEFSREFVCVAHGFENCSCAAVRFAYLEPLTSTHNPQPSNHNPQPTTHNPQPTTHNPRTPISFRYFGESAKGFVLHEFFKNLWSLITIFKQVWGLWFRV